MASSNPALMTPWSVTTRIFAARFSKVFSAIVADEPTPNNTGLEGWCEKGRMVIGRSWHAPHRHSTQGSRPAPGATAQGHSVRDAEVVAILAAQKAEHFDEVGLGHRRGDLEMLAAIDAVTLQGGA